MRKLVSLLLLLTFFSACNLAGGSDKYSIQGTIKTQQIKEMGDIKASQAKTNQK